MPGQAHFPVLNPSFQEAFWMQLQLLMKQRRHRLFQWLQLALVRSCWEGARRHPGMQPGHPSAVSGPPQTRICKTPGVVCDGRRACMAGRTELPVKTCGYSRRHHALNSRPLTATLTPNLCCPAVLTHNPHVQRSGSAHIGLHELHSTGQHAVPLCHPRRLSPTAVAVQVDDLQTWQ